MTDKQDLSEQDICTQYILPALVLAGWDILDTLSAKATEIPDSASPLT